MLSLQTRKNLHDIGWTRIRQSDIRKASRCGEQLLFSIENKRTTMSAAALLGTVFHEAIAEPSRLMSEGSSDGYWPALMSRVRDERGEDYTLHGKEMISSDYDWLADQLRSGERLGVPAHVLAAMVLSELSMEGWTVTKSELFLKWEDHGEYGADDFGEYPISFIGTLDCVMENQAGQIAIADVKTSGLWGPLIKLKGKSIVTQNWSKPAVTYHRQLRHYDWLSSKVTGDRASFYGLLHPANLIPYKTGAKKGKIRGPSVNMAPTLTGAHLDQYEEDVIRQVSSFAAPGGLGRDYPEIYGKSECPRCGYFSYCVGQQ